MILGSIVNTIHGLMWPLKRKKIYTWTSYNFCTSTLILKLEMATYVIHCNWMRHFPIWPNSQYSLWSWSACNGATYLNMLQTTWNSYLSIYPSICMCVCVCVFVLIAIEMISPHLCAVVHNLWRIIWYMSHPWLRLCIHTLPCTGGSWISRYLGWDYVIFLKQEVSNFVPLLRIELLTSKSK